MRQRSVLCKIYRNTKDTRVVVYESYSFMGADEEGQTCL